LFAVALAEAEARKGEDGRAGKTQSRREFHSPFSIQHSAFNIQHSYQGIPDTPIRETPTLESGFS
jgi:hypothetical protein